jgi:hypothetical protein
MHLHGGLNWQTKPDIQFLATSHRTIKRSRHEAPDYTQKIQPISYIKPLCVNLHEPLKPNPKAQAKARYKQSRLNDRLRLAHH